VAEALGDFQNANAWLAHVYEDAYNTSYEGWRILDQCIVVEKMQYLQYPFIPSSHFLL